MVQNSVERLGIHAWKRQKPGQEELSYQGTASGYEQTGTPLDSPLRGQVKNSPGVQAQVTCLKVLSGWWEEAT